MNSSEGRKLIIIGFGSISKAVLPLFLREQKRNFNSITVVSENVDGSEAFAPEVEFINIALTAGNYEQILSEIVGVCDFILNLSINVSSEALIAYAQRVGALYLDTCIEPWEGFYTNSTLSTSDRSNYALRESLLSKKDSEESKSTCVIAHGANPGLVSHFVKKALVGIGAVVYGVTPEPKNRKEWGELSKDLGVKVIHIAERDTQRSTLAKADNCFINTWSVAGFLSEAGQPAELGWGTHENDLPLGARSHENGCKAAIYLEKPGAGVPVKTWTPIGGPCQGLLITHNEAVSIADYFTVSGPDGVAYRPTVHYAYNPCEEALLSLHSLIGGGWNMPDKSIIIKDEIVEGVDALGVLIMGHELNAYWYGSLLSIDEARRTLPFNNATSLQVVAGVYAGVVWALENPQEGVVEAEDMDYKRVLGVAEAYLGEVVGIQTDWQPIDSQHQLFRSPIDIKCPWQFSNFTTL